MLCDLKSDTKDTVLSKFATENLIGPETTDGRFPVMSKPLFDKANQEMSDELYREYGVINKFFTRINDYAVFHVGTAMLADSVQKNPTPVGLPSMLQIKDAEFFLSEVEGELFHGSRFDFNSFDMSKIGTGQTSQDFGWGLYLTNKQVMGEFYGNMLSNTKSGIDKYNDIIKTHKQDIKDHLEKGNIIGAKRSIDRYIKQESTTSAEREELTQLGQALDRVQRFSYLYNVKYDLNSTELLNYTERPSTQEFERIKSGTDVPLDSNMTVSQIYNALAKKLGQKAASEYLLSRGFDGIKYPIGSKTTGEYNYVFFDTQKLTIVGKNLLNFEGVMNIDNAFNLTTVPQNINVVESPDLPSLIIPENFESQC